MQAAHIGGRRESPFDVVDAPEGSLVVVHRETTRSSYTASPERPVPLPAPVRWVIGALVAMLVLGGLTMLVRTRVERSLHDRTVAALIDAGLDPADFTIEFDHRSGRIVGSLPDGWTPARFNADVRVEGASSVDFVRAPGD